MTHNKLKNISFRREKTWFRIQNINLLIMLTHRSYVNEHKASVKEHNERLEFLGDAVVVGDSRIFCTQLQREKAS